ncbi:MAG TPA: 2-oxo acid dehydrogenase subunit E2 [Bacteroidales bacterium]|jgi:pyruvate/2-oxoglutarate dehydrogenase complex dihydrolipoamide acyltransferase (E2) component|nr:2-oxo acid dehydrogenase subunit E2 [Bacteroidales bacterium]
MNQKTGYKAIPLTFNRKAVIASATVTKEKNTFHCITEVDISVPRRLINEYFEQTGIKLSLTAYIVTCLAQVIKDYPLLNSFIKGNKQIILEDVTVSVLIEREIKGERVPEPLAINNAQTKTYLQINNEIRTAQNQEGEPLGKLTKMTWIKFIPGFLMRTFVRIADKNIKMGKRYGKVAVTAVGMFNKTNVWFIPHGSATVLITVGGINSKLVKEGDSINEKEHLCLTASFNHDIVDGAPASRFMNQFIETVKSGRLLIFDKEILA